MIQTKTKPGSTSLDWICAVTDVISHASQMKQSSGVTDQQTKATSPELFEPLVDSPP